MIFQALCSENQEIEINALRAITALMQLIGKSIQNDETEISTKKFVDRAIRGKTILLNYSHKSNQLDFRMRKFPQRT